MAFLIEKPHLLRQITKEIRDTFDDISLITVESVSKLPFVDACVKETLRVYSPICGSLPRITPYPGFTIANEWIPGVTRVSIPMPASMLSASHFHDADNFRPERWLECSENEFSVDKKAAF